MKEFSVVKIITKTTDYMYVGVSKNGLYLITLSKVKILLHHIYLTAKIQWQEKVSKLSATSFSA